MHQKLQNALQTIGALGNALRPWVSMTHSCIGIYAVLVTPAHSTAPWMMLVSGVVLSLLTRP